MKTPLTVWRAVLTAALVAACGGAAAEGRTLADYVRAFNSGDEELYANAIPNAAAEAFLAANVPLLSCPDAEIERTYYFRWWTYRKHLRHGTGAWTVSEYLPDVNWAGYDNTIVCPAGHHFREGRWLRDPVYLADLSRFWLANTNAVHRWRYSSWLYTGVSQFAELHALDGKDGLLAELLDDAVAYYRRWEEGFVYKAFGRAYKTFPMGGDGKGGFLSIDDREGTEFSLGLDGYKPLFASAMWSEAVRIAAVAERCGRAALAAEFRSKAETNRQSIFAHCWNPEVGFFTTCLTNGVKGTVRELHGYAPWYFGLPTEGRAADFDQLVDPQGFAAKFGLSFPERRAPGFAIRYEGHACQWDGPSWPFATSVALTAYANELHRSADAAGRARFTALLHQYAAAQRLGDKPWIDENLDPDTGVWIARKMLLDAKSPQRERGKDYNHSTFCDLVISGLVGFVPNGAKGFAVDPLFPTDWEHLSLERVRYRGHDVSVRWRRDDGLVVLVDGREAARRLSLGKVEVALPEGRK